MGEQVPEWSFCGGTGRGFKGGESTRSCYEIRSMIDLLPRLYITFKLSYFRPRALLQQFQIR